MSRFRIFTRNRSGSAAIEFALLIPVFLSIIFTTLEAGWYMTQSIMLDRALDKTVRDLRLGLIASPTQTSVRAAVCNRALVLVRCEESLALEFIPIVSDSSYPADSVRCINRSTEIEPVLRFDPGARAQTVFVRACFVVDPITPFMGAGLNLPLDSNGERRLMAKSAFANEP